MNKLVTQQTKTELAISTGAAEVIQSSIAVGEITSKTFAGIRREGKDRR